ncbi:MAG: hypothetical protein JWQ88_2641 [Rhodoferax sp.]|nr:hypothetical protein [Rhodoferax sp.]
MASRAEDIIFTVPGETSQATPASKATKPSTTGTTGRGLAPADARGKVVTSVRLGTKRGRAAPVRVAARPGRDVVVLRIAQGPTLVLHPEDARDLMLAQSSGPVSGATTRRPVDEIAVPAQLQWPRHDTPASRGWAGQAVLDSFEVVTGLFKDTAVTLATAAITRRLDGQVAPGLYALPRTALPASLKEAGKRCLQPMPPAAGPLLVLLHGTFVDTPGTFGLLWTRQPALVAALFAHYGERVYGYDHATLGTGPIANALALAQALPTGARLHLLAHSRGGLVGEILARACAPAPLTDGELACFADPAHHGQRDDLLALVRVAREKRLAVERLVRVGCPVRGTMLASRRLDAYLSVIKWGLELASVPVAPQLVDFLYEVARRRANPAELPGLEAMMPDSPLVQWLNQVSEPVPGQLRVVAGDMQGDSVGSWAKTLLADAFFWTDNDLVVQTRSMYGGLARSGGASFLLDRGGQVSHFGYFANAVTASAAVAGLTESAPAGFKPIGPLSWAGQDASGSRAAPPAFGSLARAVADPARPAVFVLPGILGSNLQRDGQRIWVGLRFVNGLKKLAWDPATADLVTPDGPVGKVYDKLIGQLAATHEVVAFAYDWRRPLEDEARRLALAIEAALDLRQASGQPVRILAHSMGGLLARTLQLEQPAVWRRMMDRPGARLLMLGTPNAGSWSPMQVLSGDDTFGNALSAFGALFDNRGARQVMAGMPGFLQLQAALLDPAQGLDREATWQRLADEDLSRLRDRSFWHDAGLQLTAYQWDAPPQAVLDQAVALRRRLDQQAATLGEDAGRMLLVAGHARFTPDGITLGAEGLEYLGAPDQGDGRATLASARLPGVATWQADAAHGDLPGAPDAIPAYIELLQNGTTALLPRLPDPAPGARALPVAAARLHARPSRGLHEDATAASDAGDAAQTAMPVSEVDDLFTTLPPTSTADAGLSIEGGTPRALSPRLAPANDTGPLPVSVLNGDLRFVHQPLIVGHYRALLLTGTEAVVDGLLGHAMRESLAAGLYPDAPGAQQVFMNLRPPEDNLLDLPRPHAVVVAGLGNEGKLRATDLAYTVCQAVLAYAQRVAERRGAPSEGAAGMPPADFEMAATLVGSGGTGVTAGAAAQAVAQGAFDANQKLRQSQWPVLRHLTLVEVYLDRAAEAWRALQVQATAAPGQVDLVGTVRQGTGAMRRLLDSSYRGAAYDLISALTGPAEHGQATIAYTLDTRRARTEVRALQTQGTLLRELVQKASNDANRDPLIGRTLFNLLVPVEMEPFLGGTSEMIIELDSGTAVIPWELLDTGQGAGAKSGDIRPWAIRSKLLRRLQLSSEQFRMQVSDATADDNVLVIGEPLCDGERFLPLPGARAEAHAVAACVAGGRNSIDPDRLTVLASGRDDARSVINALFERPYRVVHIAGHGMPAAPGQTGGVVLSGETFLGAAEVQAMRTVPELVFLNCCHLAGRSATAALMPYDRASFAANMADALIGVGVRCVIAAGWAVEDAAAECFATTFYDVLLRGERFIDAVAAARTAAWQLNPAGNTWAAYQCYGDPSWPWRRGGADAQRAPPALADEFASVSSPVALTLALENLVVGLRFGGATPALQRAKVAFLAERHAGAWGGMGAVAESFGLAFAEAQDLDQSIDWYRRALAANDGSASLRAVEQLGNLLARRGELAEAPEDSRRDIDESLDRLQRLASLLPTAERHNLLGSAWKRRAMVASRSHDGPGEREALEAMVRHYGLAEALTTAAGDEPVFYAALNGIAGELRLAILQGHRPRIDPGRLEAVRHALQVATMARPDFWSVVGGIELRLQQALADGNLARIGLGLLREMRDLKGRVPSPAMWASVHAQARFTLVPYQAQAKLGEPERRAAQALLDGLAPLAMAQSQAHPSPL